ncbi:MAG: aspartate carbamoyltransferase, partial [Aquiluna sp.]
LEDQPDVVMMLRVQRERMQGVFFPSEREYAAKWSLSGVRFRMLKDNAVILHPGPMNRGFEISDEAADDPRSAVLTQVRNGLSVRMAVLYKLLAGEG